MWAKCAASNIVGSVGLPVVDVYGEIIIRPSIDDVKARMPRGGGGYESSDVGVAGVPVEGLSFSDPEGDEGLYTGPVDLQRRPHGLGALVYTQGDSFYGEFRSGQMLIGRLERDRYIMNNGDWDMDPSRRVQQQAEQKYEAAKSAYDNRGSGGCEDDSCESSGGGQGDLSVWLAENGMGQFEQAFANDLGVTDLADLAYITAEDLTEIGMRGVKARRFLQAANSL